MDSLLPIPLFLKSIRPYVKVGIEVARKDPVVSYNCNFFALQAAMKTNYKSSPEAKKYLLSLMNFVEKQKEALKADPEQSEAMASDITSQAVVESAAMKLFVWADSQDRAGVFNKHVVKSFYTASILFDVMEVFEEPLSDDAKTHRKYARWKATYIHNCLKNNEEPIPGPVGGLTDEFREEGEAAEQQPSTSYSNDQAYSGEPSGTQTYIPEVSAQPKPAPRSIPPAQISSPPAETDATSTYESQSNITTQNMRDAEKLCKFAASALQYEDVPTAIANLEKCLRLLRTGKE